MSDLFADFNARQRSTLRQPPQLAQAQTGWQNSENSAIFSFEKHSVAELFPDGLRGRGGKADLRQAVVGGNHMAMALPHCRVLRWHVGRDSQPEEIEVCRPGAATVTTPRGKEPDTILRIFQDPHGFHLIVAMCAGEYYYLHSRTNGTGRGRKASVKLTGWRGALSGSVVESIAFDSRAVTETSTKSFLLGTSNGRIYEAIIDSSGKAVLPPTLLYELQVPARICSLHVEPLNSTFLPGQGTNEGDGVSTPTHSGMENEANRGIQRSFIMAATDSPTRLYTFLGVGSFGEVFQAAKVAGSSFYTELGSLDRFRGAVRPELHCYKGGPEIPGLTRGIWDMGAARGGAPGTGGTLFSLLSEHGIYHGQIVQNGAFRLDKKSCSSSSASSSSSFSPPPPPPAPSGASDSSLLVPSEFILEPGLMPYQDGTPISINLTAYHFLLLYPDRLCAVNRLSGDLVQNVYFAGSREGKSMVEGDDPVLGLTRDETTGNLWIFSASKLWQLRILDEDRDIWLLYLGRALNGNVNKFDDALKYAKNDEQRSRV
jgi:hypothetical protein